MKFTFLFTLLFSVVISIAQNKARIDSLENVVKTTKVDDVTIVGIKI